MRKNAVLACPNLNLSRAYSFPRGTFTHSTTHTFNLEHAFGISLRVLYDFYLSHPYNTFLLCLVVRLRPVVSAARSAEKQCAASPA
jgi:hypothetical protein